MSIENINKQPTIVFDLGGVLIDWNPRYLYRKMFDGNDAEMNKFLTNVCPLSWNAKQDEGRSFSDGIAERIHLFPEYAPFIEAYFGRWQEMLHGSILGTVHILSTLREQGYHLCALSNWSAETFPVAFQRFEFLSWFDEIVISGQEKMAKPNAEIYELLLSRINRHAEQCLFIDDSEQNILAANQLGFQTIHFSSPEHLLAELSTRNVLL